MLSLFFAINPSFSQKGKVVAPKHPEHYANPIPQLPLSRFSIPVKFLISALEHEVNYHIGDIMYEDNDPKNDQVILTVVKSGKLTLVPKGNAVAYKFPIRIEGVTFMGKNGTPKKETFCCDLVVDFTTSFSIGENWELVPHTEYKGHEWLMKPNTCKDATFDVVAWMDEALDKKAEYMDLSIDEYLRKHLDIKSLIEEAWVQIQDPVDAEAVAVALEPKSVAVTPLKAHGDNISLSLSILTYTHSYMHMPHHAGHKSKLPPPMLMEKDVDTGFVAHISTKINYAEMDTLLNHHLAKQSFVFNNGKKSIKLSHFHTFSSGDRLMIRAHVHGALEGTIYIKALPSLDTATKTLGLKSVEFELQTLDILQSSAAWIMNGTIEKEIQKTVAVPYGTQLDHAKSQLNNRMQKVKVGDNLELRTHISQIFPNHIYVSKNGLEIRTVAVGNMDLVLY